MDRSKLTLPNGRSFQGQGVGMRVEPALPPFNPDNPQHMAFTDLLFDWPQHNHTSTYHEGWQLVAVYGDPQLLEIQRTDDYGTDPRPEIVWSSDEKAREFVRARAQSGSPLHQQALYLHANSEPALRDARAR